MGELIDATVERRLKPVLLRRARQQLDEFAVLLPDTLRLPALAMVQDGVGVTACPAGDSPPFLVLPTRDLILP